MTSLQLLFQIQQQPSGGNISTVLAKTYLFSNPLASTLGVAKPSLKPHLIKFKSDYYMKRQFLLTPSRTWK